ncbi:MAG: hypothetical protein EPN91_09470 [Salinibacterium sp.]|nr:MAG: hypothetical protein EPN91_09470 [Salinibacterium sp.]
MSRTRFATVAAVALIASVSLGACAKEPVPVPTASETPSATPTPAPPSKIILDGKGVSVNSDDGLILEVLYSTDIATAVSMFSDAIGEDPVITSTPDNGACDPARTTYDWGGIKFDDPGFFPTAGDAKFGGRLTGTKTTGGITVETLNGQHIGSTPAEMDAAIPDARIFHIADSGTDVFFDVQDPEDPQSQQWGVTAVADSGKAFLILAPNEFQGGTEC